MSSTQNTSSSKGKYLQYVKVLSNRPQRNTENKTVLCGYTCLEDDIFGEVESFLFVTRIAQSSIIALVSPFINAAVARLYSSFVKAFFSAFEYFTPPLLCVSVFSFAFEISA